MTEHVNRRTLSTPRAPDGGWGWMVVLGSFMIHVITDGVTYSFGVFYDEFLTYFKQGKGPTAWILSILVGVTLCSGPISSMMVNRWGCRVVTIAGSVVASISMMVSVWANSIYVLYVTIGIGAGLGFGLIYLPAIVCVSTYFEEKRSLATGIAVCGSGFGTFVFAPLITKLLSAYGWKNAMLIVAVIVMTCIFFGALFRPLREPPGSLLEDNLALKATEAEMNLRTSSSFGDVFMAPAKANEDVLLRPWSSGEFKYNYGTLPRNSSFITSTKSDSAGVYPRQRKVMERPDIFYQRSLTNLSANDLYPLEGTESLLVSTRQISMDEQEVKCSCLTGFFDSVTDMLDLGLLKDSVFILFSLSNFLTSIGFNVPYVYIVSRAKSINLTGEQAGILLSVIGIANTIGRIILGYLSDKPWVNRLYVYNTCLTVCGVATAFSCFCLDFYSLIFYCSVFGFTIGAYVGLTSVILVDLLGLDKLTNAFGLLLLFQGIASLVGPPIAGMLYDKMHSYDPGFYVAGITIALSGIILFMIPLVQKWRRKHLSDNDVVVVYEF